MINCVNCKNEVSERSEVCVYCGEPHPSIPKNLRQELHQQHNRIEVKFKFYFNLIIGVILLVIILGAC